MPARASAPVYLLFTKSPTFTDYLQPALGFPLNATAAVKPFYAYLRGGCGYGFGFSIQRHTNEPGIVGIHRHKVAYSNPLFHLTLPNALLESCDTFHQ